jgi:glycosyltransferase involved in cell wall biosynthesis
MLHKALKSQGHNSYMAVDKSGLNEPEIHQLGGNFLRYANAAAVRLERYLSMYSVLPIKSLLLYTKRYYHKSDIIHLQLTHALPFYSLFNVPLMSRHHKIVWTIHDPWMMSGHCIHSLDCQRWIYGCGECPDLTLPIPIKKDTTALMWRIKRFVMRNANVNLIVASQWMHERIKKSPILSHLRCHLIPFGIDDSIFKRLDKAESRKKMGIPLNAKVLAFRWTPYFFIKGSEYIRAALESLKSDKNTYLILFDAPHTYGLENLNGNYRFIDLGWVNDPRTVACALNAADIFLMPSLAESFGMMAIEAMACGTPVIVFEGTSLQTIVKSPEGGIAVPYKNQSAFTSAIVELLDNPNKRQQLTENGTKIVKQEYTMDNYVKKHFELYESILRGDV